MGEDGPGDDGGGGVGVVGLDEGGDVVGGEDFEGGLLGGIGKGVGVLAHEEGAGDGVEFAVIDDGLGDGEDVGFGECVVT